MADLAHCLGLPVPPVTLWDRGASSGQPQFVAVSAWAYEGVLQWGQVDATLTYDQRLALLPAASAMVPFEAWIGAQDRQNPGNMLVAADANGDVKGAWIDYSFSLNHSWNGNHQPNCQIVPMYPMVGSPVAGVVADVVNGISGLQDAEIGKIVNRIPSDYLPRSIADTILKNLLDRRATLRSIF